MLLYTYISRFSVTPHYQQIRQSCRHQRCSPTVPHCGFNFSHKRPTFAFTGESGYTLVFAQKDRTRGHTRQNRGRFGWGRYHYPRSVPHVSETLRGQGIRAANFAVFVSWPGALPKNAESLRNSDALMRVAVPRRRGPAGLRRPTPPAERTVLAPISPRVQLCLRRPAFPLSAFIPGA